MSLTPLITGIGLCTPLGANAASTWAALRDGKFISNHGRVLNLESPGQPRVTTLALRVAREAIAEVGWNPDDLHEAALMVGTSKGPVDEWLEAAGMNSMAGGTAGETTPLFGLGETAAVMASEMNIAGPRLTLSAACASGLVALIRAAIMIRTGEVRRALVVAAESSLHPLFIGSFNRLGVLPPDGFGCRPFDQNRAGFVISEAAAAICLEARTAEVRISDRRLAIDRFALGADATHLTGGDADGITLRRILRQVFDNRPLDLIHAHATGTVTNDPIELSAIESSLPRAPGHLPVVYSHKGALGHSLGAAGLVSIAINCLCHRERSIPPNVQTHEPLEMLAVELNRDRLKRDVKRSAAIAAGFGGAVAAVSIVNLDR